MFIGWTYREKKDLDEIGPICEMSFNSYFPPVVNSFWNNSFVSALHDVASIKCHVIKFRDISEVLSQA